MLKRFGRLVGGVVLLLLLAGCVTTSKMCTVTVPSDWKWHSWRIRYVGSNPDRCEVEWLPPQCGAECEETKEP